ncbi:MAG: protein translocase subunit SecF [Actinomycetota bacterium]
MFDGLKRLMKGESNIDVIGRSKIWAHVALGDVVLSGIGLFGRGMNFSLEFEGGTSFAVPLQRTVTIDEVEAGLTEFDLGTPHIQLSTSAGGDRELRVRTERIGDQARLESVQARLTELAGLSDVDEINVTDVGPSWGRQVSNKALRGLIVFLVLVSLYISLRFEWKMAVGALAALFHDLIATAGIYTLLGLEVSPATVIALLTLMGFSLYDTVVVFDKVKENADLLTGASRISYSQMVNRSVNQVMVRSINTSLSSVLPVAGLLFVGVYLFKADTLKDLSLAMFIGALVSTYSSIFVASPILAWLKEREPRNQQIRARAAGGAVRPEPATASAATTPSSAPSTTAASVATEAEPARPQIRTGTRPPPRARRSRGGKRRR